MQLTGILLFIAVLQVGATGRAQTVTYSARSAPLVQVLRAIEQQTGYHPFYNDADLSGVKPVTVELKAVPLREALDAVLKGQPLTYEIQGNTIDLVRRVNGIPPLGSSISAPVLSDIRGRVVDSTGAPIAGASVLVKGTQRGAATDAKGEFVIKGVEGGVTLVVTYTGFEPRQYKYSGQAGVVILLERSTSPLDQVQVIAYGTTTQRLNIGNVGSVSAEEIERQPVNNPLLALDGRVPGLFITQATGLPGGGVTVRIQGQNSINGGNDPLYIVDGVPYSSQMLTTTVGGLNGVLKGSGGATAYGGGGNGNPLSYINPSDIESIEVLKDADATSIYGSRAANGAVLITTKRGKQGPLRLDVNFQQGMGQVAHFVKMMNLRQYLDMRREAVKNDKVTISPTDANYDINGQWDTTRYTDWRKALLGGKASYTNANVNISGGTAVSQYFFGGTYHRETTVFPGSFNDQKVALHFSLNSSSVNQRFKLQLSSSYMSDQNHLPSLDLTANSYSLAPDAPAIYNADGSLDWAPLANGNSSWSNPLAPLLNPYDNNTKNLLANAVLTYKLVSGLEIKANIGYSDLQTNEFTPTSLISIAPESRPARSRSAIYTNSAIASWIVEPQLTYKSVLGPGKVDLLLGTTIQQNNSDGTVLQGIGYNSDAVLADIRAATSITAIFSSVQSQYKYNAVFSRLNYNIGDKYIWEFAARRDGSSRFGPQNRFHNFGSAAFGWIFSQEDFVKNRLPFLSFGKLKASYGTTGNDQIGDYTYMDLYNTFAQPVPYQGISALSINALYNPGLQWELSRKLSVGADLGLFKDRLLVSFDYSINRSSNELLSYALPIITGVPGITENFPATIENTSWEASINSRNIRGPHFAWSSSVTITVPRNKLVSFPNLAVSSYASRLVIGQPFSAVKVFHYLGVDPTTGQYLFSDIHGKPTPTPSSLVDNTVLINTLPVYYGGLQNTFSYKGWQLDFLVQYVKQTGLSNFAFGISNPPGSPKVDQPVSVLHRWENPGDVAPVQRYNSNFAYFTPFYNAHSNSDASYSDASFLRLKTVSLSYTIKAATPGKAGLQYCSVYLEAQNVLTITSFPGIDPESQGLGLPPLRVITAGVKFGL